MLQLRDFFHLPQLDVYLSELLNDNQGLLLVAGNDARRESGLQLRDTSLPSGRSTFFQLIIDQVLSKRHPKRVTVISENKDFLRLSRPERRALRFSVIDPSGDPALAVEQALIIKPEVLIVEKTSSENLLAVLEAAKKGPFILTQFETVFWGAGVARQMMEMGATPESLLGLAWILTVHRVPTLCAECRREEAHAIQKLERLAARYPVLDPVIRSQFLTQIEGQEKDNYGVAHAFTITGSCPRCNFTGRAGEAAVFDIFRARGEPDIVNTASLLPLENYLLQMAQLSYLALDDLIEFESDNLHHVYNLLLEREREISRVRSETEAKLAELQAANRVLERRTRTLIALQDISQALIASVDLRELAERICRRACELCGADRAVLYLKTSAETLEVLARVGWGVDPSGRSLKTEDLPTSPPESEVLGYNQIPPGVRPLEKVAARENVGQPARRSESLLRLSGVLVGLTAQAKPLGTLIVQSSQKHAFTPGEISTLQAFANQAALAMQRAGLVDQLQLKIAQLETAQVELAKKERMEHELELAREVQQSVLLRDFPSVYGYRFAAKNEPARRVGGDFYDVIEVSPDFLGLAVADVSDKGLPAALYMALTHSLLRAEARRELSPERVVNSVNQLLQELGEPSMFVTLFYAVVEIATGKMRYTRAGHERPLLLRNGMVEELGGSGTPLGILSAEDFYQSEEQIQLLLGDRLILYTDGLVDTSRPDGETFGRARFLDLLRSCSHLQADRFCEEVFAALAEFQQNADPFDDMTLLVMEIEKSP